MELKATGNRREDTATAIKALQELQSIGQTIGKLQVALRRCKPGSPRHTKYSQSLVKLENRHCEIVSFANMLLYCYGGHEGKESAD
jgi:hypothetical protein